LYQFQQNDIGLSLLCIIDLAIIISQFEIVHYLHDNKGYTRLIIIIIGEKDKYLAPPDEVLLPGYVGLTTVLWTKTS